MSRVRSIDAAYKDIKAADPGTSISINTIRRIVKNKEINVIYSGSRALICLEELAEYLNCDIPEATSQKID